MTSYLVLLGQDIGGAEKRLARITLEIMSAGLADLKLIISPGLLQNLLKQPELAQLKNFENRIVADVLSSDISLRESSSRLKNFQSRLNNSSQFHLVNMMPTLLSKKHRYIYSYTGASFQKLSLKGRVGFVISLLQSHVLDIIDPTIYRWIRNILPWKSVYRTPGTSMDFPDFDEIPFDKKTNRVVNCGTYTKTKQVDRIVEQIPEIADSLSDIKDLSFSIIGRSADINVEEIVASDTRFRELDIELGERSNPMDLMRRSKVILCLNSTSNYPSRSLLEGMSCGCLPIVTNVRNTELIAPREFAEYIPKDFSPRDLAKAIQKILDLDASEFRQRSEGLNQFLRKTFTLESSVKYYSELYNGI